MSKPIEDHGGRRLKRAEWCGPAYDAPDQAPQCRRCIELMEELAQLQALELNHEGACVRLKRERDEARALLQECIPFIEEVIYAASQGEMGTPVMLLEKIRGNTS